MSSKNSRQAKVEMLAKLAASKRTGAKQTSLIHLKEAESVYREVDEKEYATLVASRRGKEDFVVDDEGLGYVDDGEEHLEASDEEEEDYGEEEEELLEEGDGVAEPGARRKPKGAMTSTSSTGGQLTLNHFSGAMAKEAVNIGGGGAKKAKSAHIDMDALLNELDAPDEQPYARGAINPFARGLAGMRSGGAHLGLPTYTTTEFGQLDEMINSAQVDDIGMDMGGDYGDAAYYGDEGGGEVYMDVENDAPKEPTEAADAAPAATPDTAPKRTVRLSTNVSALPPSKLRAAAAAAAKAAREISPLQPAQQSRTITGATLLADGWIGRNDEEPAQASATSTSPETGRVAVAGGMGRAPGPLPVERVPLPPRKGLKPEDVNKEVDSLLFYWLDAYEDRYLPGTIYLFGKVVVNAVEFLSARRHNAALVAAEKKAAEALKQATESGALPPEPVPAEPKRIEPVPAFASCCVTVTGLERCVFVLPRERHAKTGDQVSFVEVYQEISSIMRTRPGASRSSKFAAKKAVRDYAFELADVPREKTDYLKLVYDAKEPELPVDLSGDTFSRIFGANTSPLETFILKRDIMGPCWLRLLNVVQNLTPVSWCAYDVSIENPKDILRYGKLSSAKEKEPCPLAVLDTIPLPAPELVVMSIATKTVVHPKSHQHEIVAMTLVTHKQVNMDGPSKESNSVLSAKTFVRPLSSAQPLPADLKVTITKLDPKVQQSLSVEMNEKALLNNVLMQIFTADPDVLVGHNICGFDLDIFLHRCEVSKISFWSRIGRLRRNKMPKSSAGSGGRVTYGGVVTAGRLLCDTYLAARELLRETTYTLSSLAFGQLKEKRTEIEPLEVPAFLTATSANGPLALMQHTESDARLALRLMFKLQILPLTKQLTNLAGNLWSKSLRGARAERIEYLLLHEFHRLKYIVPDKVQYGSKAVEEEAPGDADNDDEDPSTRTRGASKLTGTIARNAKKRAKPQYAGGLVLEPKKGLYDKFVLLLDFNSLYPSIIQEYNICFTTVERPLIQGGPGRPVKKPIKSSKGADEEEEEVGEDGAGSDEDDNTIGIPPLPDTSKYRELGVLPRVIQNLVHMRRQVKALLAKESNPAMKQALDIRQKALKILANSMYGCLGFTFSRFYAKPMAALVTSQGRDILQKTVNLAQDTVGCEVIYGDTDSIMIYTNSDNINHVRQLGNAVKREVNKLYKYLEIEIDGIFASMLLLKKKKYAALVANIGPDDVISVSREMKGLDMVRRDWCLLSREIGTQVLDIILSGKGREEIVDAIHTLMTNLATEMRTGKIPIEKYAITKGLNKAPQDYPDAKAHPHLQVALAMIKAGKTVNTGDHIPYVICSEPASTYFDQATGPTSPAGASPETASHSSPPQPGLAPSGGTPNQPTNVPAGSPGTHSKSSHIPAAMRAFHPEEVAKVLSAAPTDTPSAYAEGALHIDFEWYLTQQILPPVARLCEPIAGTSQGRLAECLGLDGSRFANRGVSSLAKDDDTFVPRYTLTDEERFASCEKVFVVCHKCSHASAFPGVFALRPADARLESGLKCVEPGCDGLLLPYAIASGATAPPCPLGPMIPVGVPPLSYARTRYANIVRSALRQAVIAHQQGVFYCDDPVCPLSTNGTRAMTTRKDGYACPRPGCRGILALDPKRTFKELHIQLEYFDAMFNEEKERARRQKMALGAKGGDALPMKPPALDKPEHEVFEAVMLEVQDFVDRSAYHFISPAVFGYVTNVNQKLGMKDSTIRKSKVRFPTMLAGKEAPSAQPPNKVRRAAGGDVETM